MDKQILIWGSFIAIFSFVSLIGLTFYLFNGISKIDTLNKEFYVAFECHIKTNDDSCYAEYENLVKELK